MRTHHHHEQQKHRTTRHDTFIINIKLKILFGRKVSFDYVYHWTMNPKPVHLQYQTYDVTIIVD